MRQIRPLQRMINAETQLEPLIQEPSDSLGDHNEISLLDLVILLSERKWFILRFVLATLVIAVIVAFLLPVRYEAKVTLLSPTPNSSLSSAFLGQLAGAEPLGSLGSLASLADGRLGLKNPADMYVAFLTSRSVEDAMIHRFGLLDEYHKGHISDARKELERRTTAIAGTKDGLIHLSVEDGDPSRAAELANGYVEEFRRLSEKLAITEAARRRMFFEQQLQKSRDNLAAAEEAMSKTQQSTGVLQIDSQARSLIESAASLRAKVVAKEVEIEAMRSFATDDNPNLIIAKRELAALQSQLAAVAASQSDPGSGINLSKARVTQAGMEYLRRYRDLKYQQTVFELLTKELEIAKLDEAREGSIVQVVDAAVPPDRKSSPHRVLIVIGTTIFAFLIASFWVWLTKRMDTACELPENAVRVRRLQELWRRKGEGA